eukprot:3117208-Pleurochrysis_carterae.AAC.1
MERRIKARKGVAGSEDEFEVEGEKRRRSRNGWTFRPLRWTRSLSSKCVRSGRKGRAKARRRRSVVRRSVVRRSAVRRS